MSFLNDIEKKVLVFDGSMGIMLQSKGLEVGTCPEEWNITHPEMVKEIYTAYRDAGANVIQSNTFQSNLMKLSEYGLQDKHYDINFAGVSLAKEVMGDKGYVAASIGPLGKLLEPFGELTFEQAYNTFKEQVVAVTAGGADIISFETFTDVSEMRIALLASKENCNLPVICSISYEQNGRTLMGSDPAVCACILHSLGADMIGTNCSFGPEYMIKVAESYGKTGLKFSIKPNAGIPKTVDGNLVYDETPEKFAEYAQEFIKYGARLVGGCCGTRPEFIAEISKAVSGCDAVSFPLNVDFITSSSKAVAFSDIMGAGIGWIDINKEETLKKELLAGSISTITDAAMDLMEEDCELIAIDVDVPGENELLLSYVVKEAQTYLKQPFILKSNNPSALEAALRIYKGKAGVLTNNSSDVAGIMNKYGAVNVGGFISNEK
ncbi:homocysteine S-methyltransferase family protein [Ruminiclostridium cellulolyticum]|uniref:Homocysteine S-methyltransferase n=1 Tax=Ruminiclostridium cellulolyticum (strain ATCC 35319 / DSM 5812 / JCM 6584 / H10) TaxID=394503 RepID=B8I366_RUMCH|nr:homocysteine S-methyltransferase family protein [Ruminiclostridium cellulolyticum]ACL76209.1 homocysteine S-methyltransferase [Ruminiclostridium cellulolyticum H10]